MSSTNKSEFPASQMEQMCLESLALWRRTASHLMQTHPTFEYVRLHGEVHLRLHRAWGINGYLSNIINLF